MSSWLAALGPCASPKSKAKERKNDGSLEKPLNISSLKRRGSLTDVRQSRKVATSRSFREKIQDTFDGSLRKAKKAGSLEAVAPDAHTYRNPDTNMNVSTSLSPKNYKGSSSGSSFTGPEQAVKDKFWTNFYNTLPRNRHKGDRPKDLSLQDLPVTEKDTEIDIEKDPDMELKVQSSDGQWSGYATSPRTKRKAKTLERMNSAPNTRKMGYDGGEKRAASDGKASPQIIDGLDEGFDNGSGFVVMPRSVSLQDEYWMPTHKGGSKMELRRVTPSPDRLGVRRSPVASPVQLQGHVWVKTKDGAHMELRAIERHPREIPSPSESQKTDTSSLSYATAASSLSNLDIVPRFPAEDMVMGPGGQVIATTQSPDQAYTGPYMSPEEYQANIFELIQSLNQSPPNPSSPEFKRSREGKEPRSPDKPFHTEKFIVLGSPSSPEAPGSKAEGQGSRPEDYEKREQPIFSVRAHVFQIDPDTKKNWLPASKSAVAVSYYYDSARNTYRIISVEGSKAIINSTITPNMAFTKTSQKFGQWSDPRANTVYGLGFGTEADLAKFIDKFKEVKDMTRQQMSHQNQSPTTVNGTSEDGGHTPSSSNNTTPREPPPRNFFHTRSSSLTSMREPAQQNEQKDVNLRERRNSFNTPGSNGNAGSNSPESQIKYENDRLKLALAQSSANAKKWEIELQTLKNNNARLTAALQESTTNVDEWKKQLAGYKDETGRMKKKIVELEKNQGGQDQVASLQSEMGDLKNSVETLQRENRYKDEEVDRLQQRLAEMTTRETANGNLQNKLKVDEAKALEDENRTLHKRVNELQQLLQDHRSSQDSEKQELVQLQDHLGSKITELYEFHEQVMSMIHKESNS